MVALNSSFTALAGFKPRHLLAFPMQLLNLPTEATHLLSGLSRALSCIVGDNEVRAVGRHLDPETLHLVVFGKAFDFDGFSVSPFSLTPRESIHPLVPMSPPRIIDVTVCLDPL